MQHNKQHQYQWQQLLITLSIVLVWCGVALWGTVLHPRDTLHAAHRAIRIHDTETRVGIVIYDDNNMSPYTACVDVGSAGEATGMQVLRAAGLSIVTAYNGGLVCKIGNTGCPADNCFCEWATTGGYWSYWYQVNGTWVYATEGASSHTVVGGAVEGWLWRVGDATMPTRSFDDICTASSTPLPTPTSTNTATLTATVTPLPTPTSTNTATLTATNSVPVTPTALVYVPLVYYTR